MLEYCKVLLLVPTMVVAMPLAGQHKTLDTDMVVELEGETGNMLDAMVQLMQEVRSLTGKMELVFNTKLLQVLFQELLVQAVHLHEHHLS